MILPTLGKKALLPSFFSTFSHLFYPIKHSRAAKEGLLSIEVIDHKTLKVELEYPCAYFLELTTHPLYSPIHSCVDALHPHWSLQEGKVYVCNGPFQLKKSDSTGFELIKNPYYWEAEQVKLDHILIMQTNFSTAYLMFKNKEIDWIGRPLRPWHPLFSNISDPTIETLPRKMVYWSTFNVARSPFQHLKIRQALAWAIQRQLLINALQNQAVPALSPLPFDHRNALSFREEGNTLEQAESVFEEVLKELGITKKNFPPLTMIHSTSEIAEKTVKMLIEQWKHILGISLKIKRLSWKAMFYCISEGNFDMALVSWMASIDDPIYTLNAFRYTKDSINFSRWENPTYQTLLSKADHAFDLKERRAHLGAAEAILIQEIPVISLFDEPVPYVRNNNLAGVLTTPANAVDFRNAYFIKPFNPMRKI